MNYIVFLFLCFSVLIVGSLSQKVKKCHEPVDVAVLLDTSSYVGATNFVQIKYFIRNFIRHFELKRSGLNPSIGFIVYSDKVLTNSFINFRYSESKKLLMQKMNKIDYNASSGDRLDLALKYARETLFKPYKGSRAWVPHVVLAITASARHWNSDRKSAIGREIQLLKKSGTQLMLVSIGAASANQEFLTSIVDSKDHLYSTLYPFLLYEMAEKMMKQICPVRSYLGCSGKVDIAFIVDSSGSISNSGYSKMKYFMYLIAKAVNISETGARAGVVIYSKTAQMAIKFTDHSNMKTFRRNVYRLKHMKSFTRIDLGLEVAYKQLFSSSLGGARPGVKKLAIILTDGKQTPVPGKKISLREAARPLMDSGVKTLAIGIGGNVDRQELRAMVQDNDDVIVAKHFDELIQRIQNITTLTCEQIAITRCPYAADIVFVLDTSNDVYSSHYATIKEFLVDVEKRLRIGEYGSGYGVIVYGNKAKNVLALGMVKNATSFEGVVERLPGVLTENKVSYKALELAEKILFDSNSGARRNLPKVVVWVTGGPEASFANSVYLYQVARRMRNRNVVVKVVGVGSSRRRDLLPAVHTSADVILPNSVNSLKKMTPDFTKGVCLGIAPVKCNKTLDVAFILDSSGSILDDTFSQAKSFVETIAETLEISLQKTHIAVMVYSDTAKIISTFNEIYSKKDLISHLNVLPHLRGRTRIDLALKLAASDLFTQKSGMRSLVPKVAIVITDGRQSPAADAIRLDEAAAPLLVRGVNVISIGVGDRIDKEELKMMVKEEKMSFWSESYRELRLQLSTLSRRICSNN